APPSRRLHAQRRKRPRARTNGRPIGVRSRGNDPPHAWCPDRRARGRLDPIDSEEPVMRFAAPVVIVLALLLTTSAALAADKRTVTDSALRRAEVPTRIDRVYAAGAPATVLLYTLAPDKMLGWNRPLGAYERAFVPARYADLPTLGRLTGRGNTANVETVLNTKPDVIVD